MRKPLYAVGQVVRVAHQSLTGPVTAERFRIVRRFSVKNLPDLYWIRSLVGRGQRVVAAAELGSASPNRPSKLVATALNQNLVEFPGLRALAA